MNDASVEAQILAKLLEFAEKGKAEGIKSKFAPDAAPAKAELMPGVTSAATRMPGAAPGPGDEEGPLSKPDEKMLDEHEMPADADDSSAADAADLERLLAAIGR